MARHEMPVGELVGTIASLGSGPITTDRVLDLLLDKKPEARSLDKYVHFSKDFYTRNLIYRDPLFEVMAVCWMPGQRTVIHTHNGQLGWMSVERGALAVINYQWQGCNASENQNLMGLDCLAGATELDLERREVQECYPEGPINTVNKTHTIHQVVVQGKEPVISLHVYSRPIESCVAFDLERHTCYRRTLKFYSEFGDVVLSENDLSSVPGRAVRA